MIEIVPNWHPIWVHFPIALLSLATVLFLAGRFAPEPFGPSLTSAARWNLVIGVVLLVPTLLTGYWAYSSVAHDGAGHEAMQRHKLAAWVTAGWFVIGALIAWLDRQRSAGGSALLLLVLIGGAVSVAATGYLGAENVYRHGLGVQRLPEGVMMSRIEEKLDEREAQSATSESGADKPETTTGKPEAEAVPEGHSGHDHEH
ncbi:hypothetical protein CK501_04835 [Halovibrio salipaludis]|uniref:DUF2231 domain-containing protein n=1 Tax=Halovibrio salipaludis TaxID=2032626 RepID=A0A2A2F7I7_9GAMM|nr:DUF2231 domain-containing protein [Halovibrio salipaludis]PAU80898.1 hypothetical protein CK501_04835 [Halovibrio salipaludis]